MHNKRTYAMLACAVMTWLAMPAFAADTENSPLGGGTPIVIILPPRMSMSKRIGRRKKQNMKASRRQSLRLTILLKSRQNL